MKLADLSLAQIEQRLRGDGLVLHTPPFVAKIQSNIPRVAREFHRLYPLFDVIDEPVFCDFHLAVQRESGLRGWLRPMARFSSDGERAFSTLPLSQAFHMIEWGLNWAVTSSAHDHVIYHAAVLERDGQALLLPAPPGSGKSTLTAALTHRGWRLMSDELALVALESGLVRGMARPVNLKNAAIDVIRRFAPDAIFSDPVPDTLKGTLALMRPPRDSVARVLEPAQPRWIITPRYVLGSETLLAPMPKARMLLLLAEQAFNYDIHGRAGFDATADLVDRCDCLQLAYSSLDDAIHRLDELTRSEATT